MKKIARKINREKLSIYSSYPFLSLLFLSWLAEQAKNTLQSHKLFQQIFFHVSRWNISWLKIDTNQKIKNKERKKEVQCHSVLRSGPKCYLRDSELCFKKSWPMLDHKRWHHRTSFPTDMIHCSSPAIPEQSSHFSSPSPIRWNA